MIQNPYSKYYSGPFTSDETSYIWTADGHMAFQWEDHLTIPYSNKEWIVQHLNGMSVLVPGFKGVFHLGTEEGIGAVSFSDKADAKHNTIWYETPHLPTPPRPILMVRGWGNLTGCGGHALSADEAAKIQDGFLEWAVSRLNEHDFPEAKLEEVDILFDRAVADMEFNIRQKECLSRMEKELSMRPTGILRDWKATHHIVKQNAQPWYNRYNNKKRKR